MKKATKENWSLVLSAIAIIGMVLFWWIEHDRGDVKSIVKNEVNDQLSPINNKLSQLESNISELTGELKILRPLVLQRIASLPQSQFPQAVPALYKTLQTIRNDQIFAEPAVLHSISSKLLMTDKSTEKYWPTTAEFINYKSEAYVANLAWLRQDFPLCRDTSPKAPLILSVPTPKSFTMLPRLIRL